MNECGECKLCCKLLGVEEIKKPVGKWCTHCNKTGPIGCRIHEFDQFPTVCREFECGYILSELNISYRPDKCHVVITGQSDQLGCLVVHVDPIHPEAYKTPKVNQLLNLMVSQSKEKLKGVTLIIGDKKRVLATDLNVARKIAKLIK